nr:metal ABC transporter substrate-binding protein [Paenibacillus phyllosphaerae]
MAVLLTGCGSSAENEPATADQGQGEKLKVVTTFYPMYEFSRQVAGDLAEVELLVPTGVEPHDWEPSAKDMAKVQDADLFVYNGIVEGWVESALESTSNAERTVVEASHDITLMEEAEEAAHDHDHEAEGEATEAEAGHEEEHAAESEEHGHNHGGLDPHVWLDPVLAQEQVLAILSGFEQADPANKDTYKANADAYIAKLKELDQAFKDGLANVSHREFVTQHAAFGYLAERYGLTQLPISGLTPEQEPSPDEMAEIVEFAKEHEVSTIFFETLVDPKVAKAVADEIGAATAVLNPLEGLTEEEKKSDLDYIGVMKNNLDALVQALQ